MGSPRIAALVAGAIFAAVSATGQSSSSNAPMDVAGLLARVAERVEAYYQRAQSIVCTETIVYDTIDSRDPRTRRVAFDLRMSWEKSDDDDVPQGKALRTLKTVNGRPPKNDRDEKRCLDPKPTAIDTLTFLLPHYQRDFTFTYKGIGKVGDGRTAVMVDYQPVSKDKPKFTWNESCFGIEAPTRTRGRIWVDRFAGDVLRVDESIMGPLDVDVPREEQRRSGSDSIITLDRWNVSIRYKSFTFSEPNEIVLLPDSVMYLSVIRGQPQQRITHTFTGYQRFVTGGRIISSE